MDTATQEVSTLPMKRGFDLPSIDETQSQLRAISAFQQACHQHLIEGTDYGTIPGTQKPTLLKPGAEKLVRLLGLADEYEVESVKEWDPPFFHFQVTCRLRHLGSGVVVATGVGECNSMEARYRWRWVFQSELDQMGMGGEGLRVRDINTKNGKSRQFRVLNEDIYSQVNTILKMAKKRAMVDAALSAGRLSDVFTQDLEDLPRGAISDRPAEPKTQQPKQGQAKSQAPAAKPQPGKLGNCETHDNPWAPGPEGRIGHPLGNGEWCWKDEAAPPSGADPHSQKALQAHLESLGWTWEQFLEDVIGTSWEDFETAHGTPDIAWKRFQNYQDKQMEDSNGDN